MDEALTYNVKGVESIIELARECTNLVSLVHVSTAFVHCLKSDLDEEFYTMPEPVEKIIETIENTPKEKLPDITPR